MSAADQIDRLREQIERARKEKDGEDGEVFYQQMQSSSPMGW